MYGTVVLNGYGTTSRVELIMYAHKGVSNIAERVVG